MILLLGGTSSTAAVATRMAEQGWRVLVSRATEIPMDIGTHPNIESRCGPLDDESLTRLIDQRKIAAIVDATHPYAAIIRATASRIARQKGILYFRFTRASTAIGDDPNVERAADHETAAMRAFAHGKPVLLTTGVRNLAPYVAQSRRSGLKLWARVLDRPESVAACRQAGIPQECVLTGKGPYSAEENLRQIRALEVGVLVTKDSGPEGGTLEKLQAARTAGCKVILVERPPAGDNNAEFSDVEELIQELVRRRLRR
jgi:precorrin-6A/cobalt-precorrin-6A reductase